MVKVVWAKTAIKNRNEIYHYWNSRNKSNNYSKRLRMLINQAILIIQEYPDIGKPTDRPDTRIKIIQDYFLIYRKMGDTIRILDFWDSRQDPSKFENIIR